MRPRNGLTGGTRLSKVAGLPQLLFSERGWKKVKEKRGSGSFSQDKIQVITRVIPSMSNDVLL